MKSVQIRSFFWSVFSRIRIEYGEILRIGEILQSECGKIQSRKKFRIWTLFTQYPFINKSLLLNILECRLFGSSVRKYCIINSTANVPLLRLLNRTENLQFLMLLGNIKRENWPKIGQSIKF